MTPATPVLPGHNVVEGCYAKNQPEYQNLPYVMLALARLQFSPSDTAVEAAKKVEDAANDPTGTIVTRWHLSDDDRRRVAEGQDVFLSVMTFRSPLQPVYLEIRTADEIVSGAAEPVADEWPEEFPARSQQE